MGILPLAFSLDHAGPMAWTAEDCAILLQAMAGHDPADPASANRPIPDYRAALQAGVKGLRIGLIRHFYERDNEANAATRQAIEAAAQKFAELGCSVREVTLSPLADWAACGVLIMLRGSLCDPRSTTCDGASPITARSSATAWSWQG